MSPSAPGKRSVLHEPASFPHERVLQSGQRLVHSGKNKGVALKVERRIAAMNGTMMIRAYEHEIRQRIVASTAEVTDMVRLA
jgi:hypothetical protein